MARHAFGGDLTAWVFVADTDSKPILTGSATVTFWNAHTSGAQYTDLASDAGGTSTFTSVTSDDGTGGYGLGVIPLFYGPDGVWAMWASANGGSRLLIVSSDLAVLGTTVDANTTTLTTHLAAVNPHNTQVGDLLDTNVGTAASRTSGDFLGWDSSTLRWILLPPAAATGAVLLNPPLSGGSYVGNTVVAPLSSQGASGTPWLTMQQPYSSGDTNPDAIQLFSTRTDLTTKIKTAWFNGNNEFRSAPSTAGRIGFRAFESYEVIGASTSRFAEFSTNPTNSANREPLLGIYGTGSSTKPGWTESTRILSAQQGVAVGGNFNSLSQLIFRGRQTTAGAPASSTWTTGDIVIDSTGVVYLCTASGTPGTWVGASAPSAFTDITAGTNVAHATKHAASRLERGGDAVRLRGEFTISGALTAATLGTITTAHRPATAVNCIVRTTSGGSLLSISTGGVVTIGGSPTSGSVYLDSVTYDLL